MEKLRWGVIGAGGIADTRTIPGILEARNAELVALTARTPERAEQLRRKHGAKRAYTSEEELLRDPEVDAVYIATPVAEHYREGTLATQAGKHILMEKPLTVSADETKALIDCCEAHKVAFGAGFMMRFGTHVQNMRRAVLDGRIGTVLSGTANFTLWMPYQSGVWRLQKKNGGGALMDMGIHCLDLISFITGMRVTQVAAMNENVLFRDPGYEVEDSSAVLLRMENGAQFFVQSSFNIPYAEAKWHLNLFGSKGRLMGDNILGQEDTGTLNLIDADMLPTLDPRPQTGYGQGRMCPAVFGNLYTREIESFSESVLCGTPLEVPATQALEVQRVVDAAYRSSREKRIISLL